MSPRTDPAVTARVVESAGSARTIERGAWSIVFVGVIVGGVNAWPTWSAWPAGALVGPLLVLGGTVGLAALFCVRRFQPLWLHIAAMAGALAVVAIPQAVRIHLRDFYSTDSAAFDHLAAQLALSGHNPYTASMQPAAAFLAHPAQNWTYLLAGGHVSAVSYPAGSFLVELPALALGFDHAVVDWMDLYAWLVVGILLFVLLPRTLRFIAALVALTPAFASIFGSGGTDAVFLPFLVLAVWHWDRFGRGRGAGTARFIGPFALGIACAIKQTPWFCLPFLAAGLFIEARRAGRRSVPLVLGYLSIVVATFFACNADYIVANARAWARGVTLPLRSGLVADGQGLVTLALHGITRGVSLTSLDLAGALVYVSLVVAFCCWYRVAKRIWLLALPLAFFVAPRSLSSYLLDLIAPALVAAICVAPALGPRRHARTALRAVLTAVPAIAAICVAAAAFVAPPLRVDVLSLTISPRNTIGAVAVRLDNTTSSRLRARLMVVVGSGHPDGYWRVGARGSVVLAPHRSERVVLRPKGPRPAPKPGTHWIVDAYTAAPKALSTSGLQFYAPDRAPPKSPWVSGGALSPEGAARAFAEDGRGARTPPAARAAPR